MGGEWEDVPDTSDDTDAAGVGDGCSQLGTGGNVHAGKHDGVVDLQEICEGGSYLLFWLLAQRFRTKVNGYLRGAAMIAV